MPKLENIDIRDVVERFGLEYSPRNRDGSRVWVRCPFCSSRDKVEYKLNIDVPKGAYRCVVCGVSGGTLDLYARLRHGTTHVKGPQGNGKELAEELRTELGLNPIANPGTPPRQRPIATETEVKRASDKAVSNTYEKLLSLPCFALTEQHRQNLRKRGLSPQAIEQNGYRSFVVSAAKDLITDKVKEVFYREKLGSVKSSNTYGPVLSRFSTEQLMIGIAIANLMLKNKCRMDGVPGFFKLKNRWCFLFETGLAVPTRNVYGSIVALQMRKDSGKLRYMTVSSRGLPRGVTANICRAHFCRANAPIGPDTKVLLTEGPLKADVALDILQKSYGRSNIAFIAIHGVSNTADLPGIFNDLRVKGGVTTVLNALDMDKLTNVNVGKASHHIRDLMHDAGLNVNTLFWSPRAANTRMQQITSLCMESGVVPIPADTDIFVRLGKTVSLLEELGFKVPDELRGWDPATKGIDDVLLLSLGPRQ